MKNIAWIIGLLIFAAALIGALLFLRYTPTSQSPDSSGTGNAAVGANGKSSIVTYTDAGFSPAELTIETGTTVTWMNESSRPLWVVDATLNTDTCPEDSTGEALNACKAIRSGGTFSHTFTTPGAVTYANRGHRGDSATVLVVIGSTTGFINPNAVPQ